MRSLNGYEVSKLLLEKGIQCIPLNEMKVPKVGFKDIPITVTFLETYKWIYEQANVLGVLTRGIWCIDVDKNHGNSKDGFLSLEANPFYNELDENTKNTMIQSAPSGGMHIIFKKREGVEYQQKIAYLDGVDIKANDNNYFVLAGSITDKGIYQSNNQKTQFYQGEFENRIFGSRGNFIDQVMERYSVKNVMANYDFSHLSMPKGKGGLGKQAYQRIIDGTSVERNNDLYLAVSYAKECNVDIEPLRILIGNSKGKDFFTESEFDKTVRSALEG